MRLHKFQDNYAPDCYAFVLAKDEKQAIRLMIKKIGPERLSDCTYVGSKPISECRPAVLQCDMLPF